MQLSCYTKLVYAKTCKSGKRHSQDHAYVPPRYRRRSIDPGPDKDVPGTYNGYSHNVHRLSPRVVCVKFRMYRIRDSRQVFTSPPRVKPFHNHFISDQRLCAYALRAGLARVVGR
ncbi:hypothetical protein EVAR_10587_1 [Eumeta japonica]|uniref:Uncharacterized protein n=1 Tax=Eumeta variegata TaxID=151549 RepID=A0A4C1U2N8_EUMVA|nr:hypothetical protein EVAR_10587_1 [Eumeta japonica]